MSFSLLTLDIFQLLPSSFWEKYRGAIELHVQTYWIIYFILLLFEKLEVSNIVVDEMPFDVLIWILEQKNNWSIIIFHLLCVGFYCCWSIFLFLYLLFLLFFDGAFLFKASSIHDLQSNDMVLQLSPSPLQEHNFYEICVLCIS